MRQTQHDLSERLQDAIATEIEFSAAMIDAGVPLSLRALLLGVNSNWRLPLIALPETPDDAKYSNMVRSYVHAGMLFTVARSYVLTIPNTVLGTFTTHGVSEGADAAFIAPMSAPFRSAEASRIESPAMVSNALRKWIPATPAVMPFELATQTNQAFQPGCPYELQKVGPSLNPFHYAEGRA
jgi:hypothetical protein